MSKADLQHRDWLLFSMQNIILSIDQSISTFIIDTPNGGKILRATQVSEETISNLPFLTNTDQNNNYLYLQDFKVYIKSYSSPLDIPGIVQTTVNAFRRSDINGFLQGNKTHFPFNPSNYKGLNFNEFIDQYTSLQPTCLNTTGYVKYYEFVLNPDQEVDTSNSTVSSNSGYDDQQGNALNSA
jgi:hypothetical protein